jgi:hypothetical protein
MANQKEIRPRDQGEQREQRSLGGAVVQVLSEVKEGAAGAAGGLMVGAAVHKGKQLLGKGGEKEQG